MPIPRVPDLKSPLLKIAEDGQDHSRSEIIRALAEKLELTQTEQEEELPSGQAKFNSRVGTALWLLKQDGLLEQTGWGQYRITQRGLDYPKKPERTSPRYDRQGNTLVSQNAEPTQSPEELLEASYQDLRRKLAEELLERVQKCSPRFFERLVVDLLVAMGYGGSRKDAGQAVGRSSNDGIDGIIKEDKLGLDVVYVQAKRWEGAVGRPVVQGFAGSLEGQRARKGVLITTSEFTHEAKDYVTRIEKKIVLIDGEQLAQLMIDHKIGVTEVAVYTVKRIDSDYFSEEQG